MQQFLQMMLHDLRPRVVIQGTVIWLMRKILRGGGWTMVMTGGRTDCERPRGYVSLFFQKEMPPSPPFPFVFH